MLELFVYNRYAALNYAKSNVFPVNKVFSRTNLYFRSNVSFIYQSLLMGGFYKIGSLYYDYETYDKLPVISKISNLQLSLIMELKCKPVVLPKESTELAAELSDLKTGDIVIAFYRKKGACVLFTDNTISGLKFYSVNPDLVASPLLEADVYALFKIPDVGIA